MSVQLKNGKCEGQNEKLDASVVPVAVAAAAAVAMHTEKMVIYFFGQV